MCILIVMRKMKMFSRTTMRDRTLSLKTILPNSIYNRTEKQAKAQLHPNYRNLRAIVLI